jgi:hypothetical protein
VCGLANYTAPEPEMKRTEMTRELKQQLWKLFDDGTTFEGVTNVTLDGARIPDEAIVKQRQLWREFRARNPKP